MKPAGGFFELELKRGGYKYHDTAFVTKSGRASLWHILSTVKPSLVYVPYYTCDSLLQPLDATKTRYVFYGITEDLEPETLPVLKPGEYFLYVNYLDLKRETALRLSDKYKERLIVDCTQAFFMKGTGRSWFFNSCRKFFGVPDGSYMYAPDDVQLSLPESRNEQYCTDHLIKRFNGHPGEGYESFQKNEALAGCGTDSISLLSEYLLSQVDYKEVMQRRLDNYSFLSRQFNDRNLFPALQVQDNVPMHYPLLPTTKIDRSLLFKQNIFIPAFWADTLNRTNEGFAVERRLSEYLLPLPVDHRYDIADMERIAEAVKDVISVS
jgi:hypothetical protein